jgi:hypothetical protein
MSPRQCAGFFAAALVAAFLIDIPPVAHAANAGCLGAEEVASNVARLVGRSLEVDEYGPQGVKAVIAPAYRAVYGDDLRPADAALVFGSAAGAQRSNAEVLVVLFRHGCVVGWAPIPRQIYEAVVVAGRPA